MNLYEVRDGRTRWIAADTAAQALCVYLRHIDSNHYDPDYIDVRKIREIDARAILFTKGGDGKVATSLWDKFRRVKTSRVFIRPKAVK
jgi:hypothetical protein